MLGKFARKQPETRIFNDPHLCVTEGSPGNEILQVVVDGVVIADFYLGQDDSSTPCTRLSRDWKEQPSLPRQAIGERIT